MASHPQYPPHSVSFLDLPAEIRAYIYEYVTLQDPDPIVFRRVPRRAINTHDGDVTLATSSKPGVLGEMCTAVGITPQGSLDPASRRGMKSAHWRILADSARNLSWIFTCKTIYRDVVTSTFFPLHRNIHLDFQGMKPTFLHQAITSLSARSLSRISSVSVGKLWLTLPPPPEQRYRSPPPSWYLPGAYPHVRCATEWDLRPLRRGRDKLELTASLNILVDLLPALKSITIHVAQGIFRPNLSSSHFAATRALHVLDPVIDWLLGLSATRKSATDLQLLEQEAESYLVCRGPYRQTCGSLMWIDSMDRSVWDIVKTRIKVSLERKRAMMENTTLVIHPGSMKMVVRVVCPLNRNDSNGTY